MKMTSKPDKNNIVTDVIAILDESASMAKMDKEPIDSINFFFKEQKKQNDNANATLVTFNTHTKILFENKNLSDLNEINYSDYHPQGGTALNDAICSTINKKLNSSNPDNVVLLIITDGEENSSQNYSNEDTRNMISLVEDKHSWKVIFMGANIDAFSEGNKMNINTDRCAQYDQMVAGDLLSLCRTVSQQVSDYRRSRSEGDTDPELKIPGNIKMNRLYTNPVGDQEKKEVSREVLAMFPQPLTRQHNVEISGHYGRSSMQSPVNTSSIVTDNLPNVTMPDGTVIWI